MATILNGLFRAASNTLQSVPVRRSSFIGKDLIKFYKNAHITQVPGRVGYYEINLDTKKLKTPVGNVFQVPGESLALAVAAEWNSQKETIQRHAMHITSLCNTAIDNPTHKTRSQVVRAICHFLSSDTLCYRMSEPERLLRFQETNWDPVLQWFRKRYGIELEPTADILPPQISQETYLALEKQLTSYTDWTLVGLQQSAECLKSLSLALALCESEIEVERAVYLSRLEQAYQVEHWGSVEWYHDIEMQETQARASSSAADTPKGSDEKLKKAELLNRKIANDLLHDLRRNCHSGAHILSVSDVNASWKGIYIDLSAMHSDQSPTHVSARKEQLQTVNANSTTPLKTSKNKKRSLLKGCWPKKRKSIPTKTALKPVQQEIFV